MSDDVRFLRRMMRESIELRAQETMEKKGSKDTDWLAPFQVSHSDLIHLYGHSNCFILYPVSMRTTDY